MLILADTGILLRLVDPAEPLAPVIESKIVSLESQGDDIVTTLQNHTEFWSVSTRPATVRGGYGLSIAEADRRLDEIEKVIATLAEHAATRPNWRKIVVTHQVRGKQVHDARLVASMIAHGITRILTLNAADFARYPQITVIDPSSP